MEHPRRRECVMQAKADLRGSGAFGAEANDAYSQGILAGKNTRLHQGMQADKRGALSETRYLGRA